MHEDNDVPNRYMTWWKRAWCIRIDGGAPEEGAESGVQPGERPNRLATKMGSERPSVKPKRWRGRNGKEEEERERETEHTMQREHSTSCAAFAGQRNSCSCRNPLSACLPCTW